jgi:hypothetical protein
VCKDTTAGDDVDPVAHLSVNGVRDNPWPNSYRGAPNSEV